jgi:hypothetical protein
MTGSWALVVRLHRVVNDGFIPVAVGRVKEALTLPAKLLSVGSSKRPAGAKVRKVPMLAEDLTAAMPDTPTTWVHDGA